MISLGRIFYVQLAWKSNKEIALFLLQYENLNERFKLFLRFLCNLKYIFTRKSILLITHRVNEILFYLLYALNPSTFYFYCGFCLSGHFAKSDFVRLDLPGFVLFGSKSPLEGTREL